MREPGHLHTGAIIGDDIFKKRYVTGILTDGYQYKSNEMIRKCQKENRTTGKKVTQKRHGVSQTNVHLVKEEI